MGPGKTEARASDLGSGHWFEIANLVDNSDEIESSKAVEDDDDADADDDESEVDLGKKTLWCQQWRPSPTMAEENQSHRHRHHCWGCPPFGSAD